MSGTGRPVNATLAMSSLMTDGAMMPARDGDRAETGRDHLGGITLLTHLPRNLDGFHAEIFFRAI